jgi:hypothetical protein
MQRNIQSQPQQPVQVAKAHTHMHAGTHTLNTPVGVIGCGLDGTEIHTISS